MAQAYQLNLACTIEYSNIINVYQLSLMLELIYFFSKAINYDFFYYKYAILS